MGAQLHPLAYAREAERCAKLSRLAAADLDAPTARRMAHLARFYQHLEREEEGSSH